MAKLSPRHLNNYLQFSRLSPLSIKKIAVYLGGGKKANDYKKHFVDTEV